MPALKLLAHTVADVYELSNEGARRYLKRTGLLQRYLRFSLKLTNTTMRLLGVQEGPLFREGEIDTIVNISMESMERTAVLSWRYWHAVIDEGTLEPAMYSEMVKTLLEESLKRYEKLEIIWGAREKSETAA